MTDQELAGAGSDEGEGERPARAWTVIAVMGGIAVVAVVGIVGWARLAGAGGGDTGNREEMPTELASGVGVADVPAPIAAAVAEPVVGTRVSDDAPEMLEACRRQGMNAPDGSRIVLAPDGAVAMWPADPAEFGFEVGPGFERHDLIELPAIEMLERGQPVPERFAVPVPDGPPPADLAQDLPMPDPRPPEPMPVEPGWIPPQPENMVGWCGVSWRDGKWREASGGFTSEFETGARGFNCCDRDGFGTAQAFALVPDSATFALHERDGWWVAYPVAGERLLALNWRVRQDTIGPSGWGGRFGLPPDRLLFLTDNGEIVEEQFVVF